MRDMNLNHFIEESILIVTRHEQRQNPKNNGIYQLKDHNE